MTTYAKNITDGTNVYIPAEQNNQHINAALRAHLVNCHIAKVTIEYVDDKGRVFQVIQKN